MYSDWNSLAHESNKLIQLINKALDAEIEVDTIKSVYKAKNNPDKNNSSSCAYNKFLWAIIFFVIIWLLFFRVYVFP